MTSTPKVISFELTPNDDPELTCIVCYPTSRRLCDFSFTVRGDGRQSTIGVHGACVPRLEQRNTEKVQP